MKDVKLFDVSNGFDVAVQAKNKFAKLLASENIYIEFHKGSQPSFDVISRVLTLPVWEDYTEASLDRFLGHEVSHAVFTPIDETKKFIAEINLVKQSVSTDVKAKEKYIELKTYFSFLNCVEDVRIEKLILRKFPGLYPQFKDSSLEFIERDYFKLIQYNGDYSKINLADRINLFFKLDIYCNELDIKFENDEKDIVTRISQVETFAEVKILAKELMEMCKDKHPEMFSPVANEDNVDNINQTIDNVISTQSNWNNSINKGAVSNTPQNHVNSLANANQKAEFIYQDKNFEGDRVFERIVPLDKVKESFKLTNHMIHYKNDWDKFTKEINMYLSSMINTFQRKKSAKMWQNKQKNVLGELDLNALFKYKISDEIFKSETVVKKGKNHTIVMFIDYSSSMSDTMPMVLQQLYLMVKFCRLAGVKHVIYGFTDRGWRPPIGKQYDNNTIEMSASFKLVELFNHSMKEQEVADHFLHLYSLNYIPRLCGGSVQVSTNSYLSMGGTPLNETLLLAHSLLPLIKEQHKSDVMSVIMLTDGDSNGTIVMSRGSSGRANMLTKNSESVFITSKVTGKTYKVFDKQSHQYDITATLAQMLKEDYGYKLINFHILEEYFREPDIESYIKRYLNKTNKNHIAEMLNLYKQSGRVLLNNKISRVWDANILSKDSMLTINTSTAASVRQTQQILELVVSLIS